MPDDPFGNDAKQIWQNQPTEIPTVTLKLIRQRARELRAKTRRELFRKIAVVLFAVALSGAGIALADDLKLRLAFALAIVWAFAGQYFLHRGMWGATLPGDAALKTGLEFCRQEIEGRRQLFRRTLQWSFGPVVLTIGAWILPILMIAIKNNNGEAPVQMIPFFVLLAIWITAVFVIRFYGHRELQREIDELNEIEKSNGV